MSINYQEIIAKNAIPLPCFILEESALRKNCALIQSVAKASGAEIILAFKGFALWKSFPILKEYIRGATASSAHEAMLCVEELGTRAHTYAPAYAEEEFDKICELSSHITFNSISQYQKFYSKTLNAKHKISCGIRLNPEWSDVHTDLYNPASPSSRLGVTSGALPDSIPEGLEGIHFHVLCESSAEALEQVLLNLEQKFSHYLKHVQWVNFGGGHLMTRKDYNIPLLIELIQKFSAKWDVQVILEPGSAFAWQTGVLATKVLDIIENNGIKTAILNASFTAHMPDTLEMPYRPTLQGAHTDGSGKYQYRLGGVSCLAGDFHEVYGFDQPVQDGDLCIFDDMIHYTMVKSTTFNGVKHPSIAILKMDQSVEVYKNFDYLDFKNRLS